MAVERNAQSLAISANQGPRSARANQSSRAGASDGYSTEPMEVVALRAGKSVHTHPIGGLKCCQVSSILALYGYYFRREALALSTVPTSVTYEKVRELVAREAVKISSHGYDELAADDIMVTEAIAGLQTASVVEDYPDYGKGPCVLTLQQDSAGAPVHVVWGIPMGKMEPAVLITAYRPDPKLWENDFLTRRP
jgi:hypothetical protein